ncbi:MUC19 [Vulpes lagopus]
MCGKIAERTSGGFLFSSLNFGDPNRRKKSLVGSLLNIGFNAPGALNAGGAEDGLRKHRDTDSLVLKDTPAADNTNPRSRAGFSSSVSGNLGFGLGAPDPKGLGIGRADWSARSSRGSAGGESVGFGFNARSSVGTGSFGWELGKRKGNAAFGFGASGSSSFGGSGGNGKIKIEGSQMSSSGGPVPKKLGDTSLRNQNTLVGDSSGKSETNLGVSDEQGFGINEIGGNRMNGSRSAGAGFKGFGSDAGSSGNISAKIGDNFVDDLLENLKYDFEKFGQKGFESSRFGQSDKSSRESDASGSGSLSVLDSAQEKSSSFDLRHGERKREVDLGDSGSNRFDDIGLSENVIKGGNAWSSGSGSGGGRKGAVGLGGGASGPNESDETGLGGTGTTRSSDNNASGPLSTPAEGSNIPEAIPKYSKISPIIGEASTWGKGAYKAFNGRIFSFESSCAYTFCHHCVESGGDFNIEIKRNSNSDFEKIAVKIDNNEVSIFGDNIVVNEKSVQIPYDNKLIHIKKYGEHYVLKSRRGILSLMWDKNKLSLALHKQYPTCGLCGNFNSTPGDNINEHIAHSKIPGDCPKAVSKNYEVCEDGVQANITNTLFPAPTHMPPPRKHPTTLSCCCICSLNHCDKIIGTYFEKCRKVAAFSTYYRMICVDDYCRNRDKNATCDTYSELSRLCTSDGPGTYESWRDDLDVTCGKPTCPEKHIYKECGPSNPATCSDVAPFQDSECVNGCICPEGYLLDDIGGKGRCVLKAECPCDLHGKIYQSGEVRGGPCGSQCTCQDAKWSCTEALCPGRCKVEGNSITTFDGVKYHHPGNCHYLAIYDKDWSVSVELRPCASGQSGTCLNSVTLHLNSSVSVDKYVFGRNGTITSNKMKHKSQRYDYSDGVYVFKPSSSYLQVETNFGVKMQIQIAPAMQLYVSLPPNDFTETVGLCGSFNNRVEDDLMSSQNILEKTPQTFADSWEMMPCPKGNPSSCISIEKEIFAENHCGIFLDSPGPFASCHPIVNVKPYYEECKRYTCTCKNSKDCLCTIFGNYVKACAEKEVYMVGWRTGLCDSSCPRNLVFKYNIKACNKTCRSLSERYRSCDIEGVPFDGCTCPDGMYQNNEGNCVPKSQCDCYVSGEVMQPGKLININNNKCICRDGIFLCQTPINSAQQNCSGGAEYVDCRNPRAQGRVDGKCGTWSMPGFDENLPCKAGCYCPVGMVRNSKGNCVFPEDCPCSFGGSEYDQGSVTLVGCNKCTCIKGSWSCTQNECQTVCHIYGEGHVRSFDGKSYSFDGLCQYSFVEDYCGRENGTFRILTESIPCCEDGLTCSRKIIVSFQDQNVVLHDGKVTASKITESKECGFNGNTYSVHTVGLYLILKFSNGITIIWDKNTRVSAILDPRWHGKVCGLCGNNNGDLKDDFITRHSTEAIGALEFGNSWKTSQKCSDTLQQNFPCDSNPYCKTWAVQKCEIIRDSIFKECHHKVDPEAYLEACIEEACACDTQGKYLGFCTAVAMYAEACSAVGVCVTWRKPDLCPVFCDYYNEPGECSWRYEPCGTVTTKTCRDQVIGQKFSAVLEGCYAKCPDNAPYLDENLMKCVTLSECSCFYNDIIPAGGVIQDNCGRTCYCIAGELECSETASANSTFTVSTTTVTSILSTESVITSVTSSSGTGTTLGLWSEPFSTGIAGSPFPTTLEVRNEGRSTEGPSFTSTGQIAGTTLGLRSEPSGTGAVGSPVATTLEAGSVGRTAGGPGFTSAGRVAGGTGSPTAGARGGTPEGPEGVTAAPGSESTRGDSGAPGTTLGGRAGTTLGLRSEPSGTGAVGSPVATTLEAGSVGRTAGGPGFTSAGRVAGGTGSPTAGARGGTPEGRAGTTLGLRSEPSGTGAVGSPVATTLEAGSVGRTAGGPGFTSAGRVAGGSGSPTAGARGGTPEGRAGTTLGLRSEPSGTGAVGSPVATTLEAGSVGRTAGGPGFTSAGRVAGGSGSPTAGARGGTPEGPEGVTAAPGSESTRGDSGAPGTTLGGRAGTTLGLRSEPSGTGAVGSPVATTLEAGSVGRTAGGPGFTSAGRVAGGSGSPTAGARGGTTLGLRSEPSGTGVVGSPFATTLEAGSVGRTAGGPGFTSPGRGAGGSGSPTAGARGGTTLGLRSEPSGTGVVGSPFATTLEAGSVGRTAGGPGFTSPGRGAGGSGSPTAGARGGTTLGLRSEPSGTGVVGSPFATTLEAGSVGRTAGGPGFTSPGRGAGGSGSPTAGARGGTTLGLRSEPSGTGVVGSPFATTLEAGSVGRTAGGPGFTSPGRGAGGSGSPTAGARGGTTLGLRSEPSGTGVVGSPFATTLEAGSVGRTAGGPGFTSPGRGAGGSGSPTAGARGGTTLGLRSEPSGTGVVGSPFATTLEAGSVGRTAGGPGFTSPGRGAGGSGSPTAGARGAGTPERSGGFIEIPGIGSTAGNSSLPGTTLAFRGGTTLGVRSEPSGTGVGGSPFATTLEAGSVGRTAGGPGFTSPGRVAGGPGSPTTISRGGTPEGPEGLTAAPGDESTRGDLGASGTTLGGRAGTPERSGGFIEIPGIGSTAGNSSLPGTTLAFRGGTTLGVRSEPSGTGVGRSPVATTLEAGSVGRTAGGPGFTSAGRVAVTSEGSESFRKAPGFEDTSGVPTAPSSSLGVRPVGTSETSGGVTSGDENKPASPSSSTTSSSDKPEKKKGIGTSREAFEIKTAPGISATGCPPSHPPPPVCLGPLGEKKSPGEEWTANCYTCTCTDANTVDCNLKKCPSAPTCKTGERLVKFQNNDTCCEIGYCEPRTCLFNSIDYEIGASFDDPNNPCISYSCYNTGFVAIVQDCPKQTWCPEEDRVYDSKKCCYTCKTNCRSSLMNVTIKYNGCQKRIAMARCVGECKKTVRYNYSLFQLTNSCLCCREDNYEFREVTLNCPGGSTIPYKYRHVTSCSCSDICQQSVTPAVS